MNDEDLKFLKDLLAREYGPEAAIEIGDNYLTVKIIHEQRAEKI